MTRKLNQIVLEKGLFASIKGNLCLTKGHLDYPEWQVQIESTLTGICFDTWDSDKEKVIFSKKALFNKASNPWALYFSKIGHVDLDGIPTKNKRKFEACFTLTLIFQILMILLIQPPALLFLVVLHQQISFFTTF